jgi:uncharacterized protein YuzE
LGGAVGEQPDQSVEADTWSVSAGHLPGRAGPNTRRLGCLEAPTSSRERRAVKIEYDPEADALYIQIREARADDNIDIEEGVTIDLDQDRHIVGIEILDASKRLSRSDLSSIVIEKLPLEMNPA